MRIDPKQMVLPSLFLAAAFAVFARPAESFSSVGGGRPSTHPDAVTRYISHSSPIIALQSSAADAGAGSPDSATGSKAEDSSAANAKNDCDLTDADWAVVDQILKFDGKVSDAALEGIVGAALNIMHPRLVLRLRTEAAKAVEDNDTEQAADEGDRVGDLRKVGVALSNVLDDRLKGGRDLLAELLKTGEIRKLDGALGKASREGKLDMAFFTVLNMNIRDAQYEASQLSEEERAKLAEVSVPTDDDSGVADRLQILQHVYTRCQEELEKAVIPGVGLLNKLLRTEDINIRANQLRHYLGPQPNVVVTPDGKEVPLQGNKEALVPPQELIRALSRAVKQIRTVEKAGGTDVETAAGLVENCRQVAIEARMAIAEAYGVDSPELMDFENGLQPVFRPTSSGSEYIKGD